MLTLFILSYTLGAVVTYGALFAYSQSINAFWISRGDIVGFGILWPMSVVVVLYFHGRKPFQSGLKFY